MSLNLLLALAVDLVAVTVLAYGIYFRRHHRRDLLLAYIALNVGVLAVTAALTSVEAGIGLGLGLFGILSIIRLRSDQITQEEIAYYFVSLALGLLAGMQPGGPLVAPAFSVLLLLIMYVVDHPRLVGSARRQLLTLDAAYTDEHRLTSALEELLGGRVRHVVVLEVDLVRDVTVVDVRYRAGARSSRAVNTSEQRLRGVTW